MTDPNFISQEAGLNFNTVVESIIKRSCIIDFGIIQEVVSDGVVDVSVAVSKTEQDMFCMTCVLANITSKAFTLDIKPHKGDRVLVVYPRLYDDNMFNFTGSEEDDTKLTVNYKAKGYNLTSGIAILISQYRESGHKNVVTVEDGNITARLSYSEDDDKNFVEVITSKDGDITVKNDKATVLLDKDGNVNIQTKGKYTFKNESTDLYAVIDGLAKELENLVTQGSPATQATSPASKATIASWRNGKLNQLLKQ